MTHLTLLECSMLADDAFEASIKAPLQQHLSQCDVCQTKVAALKSERALIRESLDFDDSTLVTEIIVPKFSRPFGLREFAIANVLTGLIVWLAQFLWKTLFGELIISVLSWFAIPVPDAYELLVNAALYFTQEGTSMINVYLGFIILFITTAGVAWIAMNYRGTRTGLSICMLAMVVSTSIVSAPAQALTYIDGDTITLDADEVINDTLILAGDTIVLEGTVNGDVLAMGRRVIVNGPINGNLVSFAQSVLVNADVKGLTIIASETAELNAATIGGDVWTATQNVTVEDDVTIKGNLITAGEVSRLAGSVGRDYYAFGDSIDITGTVGEDLEVFGDSVNLLGNAVIEGDFRFRTEDEDSLRQTSDAVVKGVTEFLTLPEQFEPKNKYATGEFYLRQMVRFLSALLAGAVILWMVPSLQFARLEGGMESLKTAGIGLVTLVSMPIVAAIIAITVIGIPITIIGLFSWMVLIYLAKIVLAAKLGQVLLSSTDYEDNLLLTLLAGLTITMIAINIPGIGGVISFIMTIVGIGMIIQTVLNYFGERDEVAYD